MNDDQTPAGSIPARPLRAVNASLNSIRAGMKPVLQDKAGNYFRFANRQVRRQIGRGHSRLERAMRRELRALRLAAIKASRPSPV